MRTLGGLVARRSWVAERALRARREDSKGPLPLLACGSAELLPDNMRSISGRDAASTASGRSWSGTAVFHGTLDSSDALEARHVRHEDDRAADLDLEVLGHVEQARLQRGRIGNRDLRA